MSMVTVAMVAPPITPTPAAIPPPRHVSFFEFFASTPPQTSPKSSWFSPNNGRAGIVDGAPWTEAEGIRLEDLLPFGFQGQLDQTLHDPVFQGRHPHSTLPPRP